MDDIIKEMEDYKQSLHMQSKDISERIERLNLYKGRQVELLKEYRNLLTSTRDIVDMRIKVWDYKIKNLKKSLGEA